MNRATYWILCEALRRYTRFHKNKPLTEAWTGLGTATDYSSAEHTGFMKLATKANPRHNTWWRLTEKGAAIVQKWLDQGYTYEDIETNQLPSPEDQNQMTYDEIISALRRGKCDSTAEALERAVEDEKRALEELPHSQWWNKRRTSKREQSAREAAQEFYSEDITRQLAEPESPTPERMLSLRRFPIAWAVAEVLRTNKLVKVKQALPETILRDKEWGPCEKCGTIGPCTHR